MAERQGGEEEAVSDGRSHLVLWGHIGRGGGDAGFREREREDDFLL